MNPRDALDDLLDTAGATWRVLRRRARTVATLIVMAGLIATAAGVQATAASWTGRWKRVARVPV